MELLVPLNDAVPLDDALYQRRACALRSFGWTRPEKDRPPNADRAAERATARNGPDAITTVIRCLRYLGVSAQEPSATIAAALGMSAPVFAASSSAISFCCLRAALRIDVIGDQLSSRVAPVGVIAKYDRPRRPWMKNWWARSDSTTQGKPLKRLGYQEFDPRRCP